MRNLDLVESASNFFLCGSNLVIWMEVPQFVPVWSLTTRSSYERNY